MHESADPPDGSVDPDRAEQDERDLGRRAESCRPVHEPDREGDGADHREQRGERHTATAERDDPHDAERDERVVHPQRDARGVELLALDLVDRDLLVGVQEPPGSSLPGEHDDRNPRLVVTDVLAHLAAVFVDEGVVQDLEQPRLAVRPRFVAVEEPEAAQHRLLHEVLGVVQ